MPDESGISPSSPATGQRTEFDRSVARDVDPFANEVEASPQAETTNQFASRLNDKLSEDFSSMKETAIEVASSATNKAEEIAEKQKSYAADQIERLAGVLERVGKELESDDAAIGGYASALGASARQFADRVKDKNPREIADAAEDFGRRQPLAFLGLAAVAGLAASRFITAAKPSTSTSAPSMSDINRTREAHNG